MEISIKRIGTDKLQLSSAYKVIDNGREFRITYKSDSPGGNLGLAGQPGFLYTDTDTCTVRRQVITVGLTCGIFIDSDEAVEGLSPWAIRGVIMAERSGETREITITAGTPEAGSDRPAVLVDGKVTDLHKYLRPKSR